ncbi:hypothetical protein [Thermaurantimonas aggregans]|uniref:hypothetical protein n=1 Tax=Thermaurantimonas aggregans TaxID=2173829 RepID=UPI0023F1968E|nr:hypothetical protein [Thermaurantimonas aggregans]MCX8149279.1 hypothetical protein [Thermaurantimonas aggregans]
MTFEELNLKPELQEAIGYMGYSTLTEIQEKTYHPILEEAVLKEGSFFLSVFKWYLMLQKMN